MKVSARRFRQLRDLDRVTVITHNGTDGTSPCFGVRLQNCTTYLNV